MFLFFFVVFKSPTHLNHYITSQHIYFNYYITIHRTHIVYLCVHFSAYFLAYIVIFILLFKVFLLSHLRHCMFVFLHTSQYDFTHISQYILRVCIRVSHMYVYVVFFLYISLYSHTSHMFLYSHLSHFVKTFFAILVLHTFTFYTHLVLTFYFQKRMLHTHLYSIFLKILEYK